MHQVEAHKCPEQTALGCTNHVRYPRGVWDNHVFAFETPRR